MVKIPHVKMIWGMVYYWFNHIWNLLNDFVWRW